MGNLWGKVLKSNTVLIYNFVDYVDFLSAWFEYQKKNQYGFSYRSFNQRSGLKSPNYLNRVITRQRKLSEKFLPNIVEGLNLDENEAQYLKLMILIDKCKIETEREELICKLITLRSEHCQGQLTKPMLHYLSHWYYPVIRELVILYQTIDARMLSNQIKPAVPIKEIKGCLDFLLKNEYIDVKKGKYVHTSPILTTGDEVVSDIVSHFHRETLMLTANELTNMPLEERDVSSLILALSEASFKKIKGEIQVFRKKLLQISEEEKKADRVYHVGFQLVPRSSTKGEDSNDL